MKRNRLAVAIAAGLLAATIAPRAYCSVTSEAVEQTSKYIMRRFGRELAEEGTEQLAGRLAKFAARHGDDGLKAARNVGPIALRVVEEAGEHSPEACRLLAQYGDDAIGLARDPQMLRLVSRFGDDATIPLLKHGRIAAPICERFGAGGAQAINQLSRRNATRLGIMVDEGSLTKIGPTDKVLKLIEQGGDKAMNFIWEHKGSLAIVTVAAAFWKNPDAFINGTATLAEHTAEPLADAIGQRTSWTWIVTLVVVILTVCLWPTLQNVLSLLNPSQVTRPKNAKGE